MCVSLFCKGVFAMSKNDDIENKARSVLKGICKVCPICDARSCIGVVPGMGGKGSGIGFRRNRLALEKTLINMRTIHSVKQPNTDYDFFGINLAFPALGAPMCETTYNFLGRIDDYAFIYNQVVGALSAGTIAFTGDSAMPPLFEMGLQIYRDKAPGKAVPVIKPRKPEEIIERIKLAENYEAKAVGIDIDAAGFDSFNLAGQPVAPINAYNLRKIIASTSLPVIIKGVMTIDEALMAVDCGAAAIVVSNHGGRSMDSTPGSAEVLPEIADAIKGSARILLDGGIRSGEDILKALALGAEAVLIGRPVAIAATGGEINGVSSLLEDYREELNKAMLLTGCKNLDSITGKTIRRVNI